MSSGRQKLRSTSEPHLVGFADPVEFVNPSSSIPVASNSIINFVKPGTAALPGLKSSETRLLREKQKSLRLNASSILESLPASPDSKLRNALDASLIFAQYEAGSAVCIDSAGWILTCAHCFGESEEEWQITANMQKWLLFYTGLAIQVECRAWDPKCDLALAKVIAIECEERKELVPVFPFASLAARASNKLPIICIGQPGRDDFESATARRTMYNLVEVSEGKLRGMVPGDPHDNSDIGMLKHDAWTYWGHSGAPLISSAGGRLVGLHSSWDDQTGMRHGIPLVAIKRFLDHQEAVGFRPAVQRLTEGESHEIKALSAVATGSSTVDMKIQQTQDSVVKLSRDFANSVIVIDDDD